MIKFRIAVRNELSPNRMNRSRQDSLTIRAMNRKPVRPLTIDQVQFGAKVGRHMLEFGRNPSNAADRLWLMQYISHIYMNATQFRDGTFSGQGAILPLGSNARGPVWFYAKQNDVVVTDRSDNFVTILKDGAINNTSFRAARILHARP
jgi:hypothetical protein